MCTASSLFQRNPTPPHTMCEGTRVSTYLALTFGTLLSSQRTDASITTLTGRSGRFPLGDPDTIKVLAPQTNWGFRSEQSGSRSALNSTAQ